MKPDTDMINPAAGTETSGLAAVRDALQIIFLVLRFVMLVLLAVFMFSGVANLEQHEDGILLRFGAVRGSRCLVWFSLG